MSLRPRRVVPLAVSMCFAASLVVAAGCTRNPYVIGSVCPPAGVDAAADPRCGAIMPPPANGTLVVGLDHSSASPLGTLALASGTMVQAALWLRGEHATSTAWPPEGGGTLARAAGTPTPLAGAPFTNDTDAVGLSADAPTYAAPDATLGAVASDDLVLEAVLRAAPGATVLAKQAGAIGWALRTTTAGTLELDVGDGDATHAAAVPSAPLTAGAWYHCLFWVSRAVGGRADCDGRAGTLTPLPPALGALDTTASLAAGGGAAVRVAHLALFRVASGGLGAESGWLDVSRRRFAVLTGVYPSVAVGTALPATGLRDSVAYVDLQAAAGGPRRLHLVGQDWPRVACRTDAAGTRDCGYLGEPHRTRSVATDASAWQPVGLTVTASATPFPDGEPRFASLAPSTAASPHALSLASTAGSLHQVFSFFVHRLAATRVGAGAGAVGTAVFDLAAGRVVSAPARVRATIEAWGGDVFRCSYALSDAAAPQTYAVRLLDDAGNETFAGAGTAALEVGGLQVDDGLVFAGSLLAADPQPPDHLTFVANDGNLPTSASGLVGLRVLLPPGARINDQAILNVNRGGAYEDQVQLYVRGDAAGAGHVKFWRLEGGAAHWAFDGAVPVIDGVRHALQASWTATSARLVIDGAPSAMQAQVPDAQFDFDRIDVGFSQASSGALEGLVAGLQIGAM